MSDGDYELFKRKRREGMSGKGFVTLGGGDGRETWMGGEGVQKWLGRRDLPGRNEVFGL